MTVSPLLELSKSSPQEKVSTLPNLLAGASTVLEIAPSQSMYVWSAGFKSDQDADALANDWIVVGRHLYQAWNAHEQEVQKACSSNGLEE